MGEAFQRNGVAIVDELLHGIVQGKNFSHGVLQVQKSQSVSGTSNSALMRFRLCLSLEPNNPIID
jgi:hypothetical protein